MVRLREKERARVAAVVAHGVDKRPVGSWEEVALLARGADV
jgi:hypothetical protein